MKTLKILLGGTLLIAFLLYAIWNKYQQEFYEGLIPPPIKTSQVLVIDGEHDIFDGCGVAAFWVSDATLESIEKKKLVFFDSATTATRMDLFNRITLRENYYDKSVKYNPWKETPMPKSTFSDGWWRGFECASGLTNAWKKKIYEAAKLPGSYYTHEKGMSDLLVLPTLKIAVLIYTK